MENEGQGMERGRGRTRGGEGKGKGKKGVRQSKKRKGYLKQVAACQQENQIQRMTSLKCCIVLYYTALYRVSGYRYRTCTGPPA